MQSRTKEYSERKGRKETGINNGNQFTLKNRTAKAHRKRLSRTQLMPHSDPVTTGARHNRVSGESCPRKRTKPGLHSLSGRRRLAYRPAVKHRPLKIKFISCLVALNHHKRSIRQSCQKAPPGRQNSPSQACGNAEMHHQKVSNTDSWRANHIKPPKNGYDRSKPLNWPTSAHRRY